MENQTVNKFQTAGRIKVVNGSILNPQDGGLRFILNVANLSGKTDGPMYNIFNKKWPKVKAEVRGWYATKTGDYKVGALHTFAVQSDVWVISMLVQNADQTTDLVGLEKCLKDICKQAKYEKASVAISNVLTEAIPELTEMVQKQLVNQGVSVAFYTEPTV